MIRLDSPRKKAFTRRQALSTEERGIKSQKICAYVQPLLHGCVGLYRAYGSEVSLSYLDTKNLRIALPKCDGKDMDFYAVDAKTQYQAGAFGILEPIHVPRIAPQELDVIVIPMVAYDEQGGRMGHGKGYYDRYLANCSALRIGVAFTCQKETLVLQEHDVRMDIIVTEEGILDVRL